MRVPSVMGDPLRPQVIAFVGGCHLVGYPIGPEQAFPALVVEALDRRVVVTRILQPVAAHHADRALGFVRAQAPDIVVLQLGNFETSLTTMSLVRRQFGLRGARSFGEPVGGSSRAAVAGPDRSAARRAGRRLRLILKFMLHRIWLHRVVRLEETAANIRSMARSMAAETGKPVIILDPLPCLDPVTSTYRAQLRELLARDLELRLRVSLDPRAFAAHGSCAYADAIHMGVCGHALVAEAVVEAIRSLPGDR